MNAYDLVIGMDQSCVNKMITSLYSRQTLRDKLFAGDKTTDILGTEIKVSWRVESAPIVSLDAPSSDQWNKAIKSNGNVQAPIDNAFLVHMKQLRLTQSQQNGGSNLETTTALSIICHMSINEKKLYISPMAVIVDLSSASESDKLIYKSIIIPKVLDMAGQMLSGEQLPKINYQGLQTGTPLLAIGNGRLVAVANLEGGSDPATPTAADFPNETFYTLFSRHALQNIMDIGAKDIAGQSTSTSGSQGFGIGKASYNASIRIDSVSISPASNDLTQADAEMRISASASAGISILPPFLGEVGQGVTTAANTVAKGTVDAANTVAHGVTKAANSVKHFFGHLF